MGPSYNNIDTSHKALDFNSYSQVLIGVYGIFRVVYI